MKAKYISVPFKSDSGSGLTEYNGVAKFSSAGIIFEFEGKLLGMIGDEVKEVRVAWEEILDIKFRKGIFKFFAQIKLRLKSFSKLSELPNEGGKIKLKIKREDFELAQRAFENAEAILLGEDPKRVLEEVKNELPPAQTSVNELFDTKKLETNDLNKTDKLK